jgi:hypothetical protein
MHNPVLLYPRRHAARIKSQAQRLQFDNEMLVSIANATPPSVVCGKIYAKWCQLGGITGEYGRPLCDERDLQSRGGCVVFEGEERGKSRNVSNSVYSYVTEL